MKIMSQKIYYTLENKIFSQIIKCTKYFEVCIKKFKLHFYLILWKNSNYIKHHFYIQFKNIFQSLQIIYYSKYL